MSVFLKLIKFLAGYIFYDVQNIKLFYDDFKIT